MLTIGFSPCPNDTFIFHGLVHGLTGAACPAFAEPLLADVETLNSWAMAEARLDVTKLSFHALGHVLDDYVLLRAGGALGRGCGPLLVARQPMSGPDLAGKRIAIPGRYTTAAMLLQLFSRADYETVPMSFETIMPSVARGEVDCGVIIHESRFTYQQHNLICLQDLGAWWEAATGHAIPLGGIAARRSLGAELLRRIEACIRQSVQLAFADAAPSRAYIKRYAQELDEQVIASHIGLYVNDFSEDLGEAGLAAVAEFLTRGRAAGILPASPREVVIC
ncbi:MAG: 1,4-dihydroxy-6-naphthoate synthase [Desulfurivibrio sp.]|nr:MAG: 1,4-dihydroxy-6-naphthoate synthase [Desulfurivibrio sp.]